MVNRDRNIPFHKVVFTDIDGTLVDINTAEYGKETDKLIRLIKERNIPLILASAKTRLEQNKIREDLGLSDPFVVENGGALVIPKGYFPDYALRDIKYPVRETQETKNGAKDVIHGGRFFDVTVGTDKGIAVGILKKLFKDKFHNNVTFFGIGDSAYDIPMLNHMDIPILVQRQDSSWVDDGEIEMKNVVDSSRISSNKLIKVEGIGPNGWENAIHKIILELN